MQTAEDFRRGSSAHGERKRKARGYKNTREGKKEKYAYAPPLPPPRTPFFSLSKQTKQDWNVRETADRKNRCEPPPLEEKKT